ncbi:MAG: formate dehydrogenase subunit alpha [Gemmatimonadetes bacterium]|nr:formate dehydrogenase subunit alpha [Gemmatimonadota bacterium]
MSALDGVPGALARLEARQALGRPAPNAAPVRFTLDGNEITALPGETILQAAARHDVPVPHLCYTEGLRPDGNCRACMVEIAGERVLAPSCCRYPTKGMQVSTKSKRALKAQKLVLELLLTDSPEPAPGVDSELNRWARQLGVSAYRLPRRAQPEPDLSHPAIEVRLDACIQCTRCVRACREEQVNDVIGYAHRGSEAKIVFDLDDPMGLSTCVACGECVQACPTGALLPVLTQAPGERPRPERVVESLCPYCGVGCQTTIHVRDDRVHAIEGRDGPSNLGRLCVKGRFGFDYVHHPQRLLKPLIRREGVPKDAMQLADPGRPLDVFREASWEEALDAAACGLQALHSSHGPGALAGFGSAKGSNEEAYLFQKLIRVGFGTNNVDHCTRLCHASSVAALMENVSSGAVSNQVSDVQYADCFLVIGANPTVNHPVAATFMKNAIERGAKLILADPRRTELARHATHVLQFRPDTDVALLNAMLHTIIDEGLANRDFIRDRTLGYEALAGMLRAYSPEAMQHICGIPAAEIRAAARLYATSPRAMIFWGMGVSQHVHGTDNARCLISLALLTGQIGRRGTGLHPLRGQNNVQGASDMGLIPMFYPDYRPVTDPAARAYFGELWGRADLDPEKGLTVVEIMNAALKKQVRGMYIMGENPAMSDPDVAHAREALAALDFLVVQDIFLTETASLADVILPASAFPEKTGTFTNTDRRVQLGRAALPLPGEVRQDLWIIQELARRLGLDWSHRESADVWQEIRRAVPSSGGITWERLEREHAVTYPCRNEGDPGESVIFTQSFPTPTGRAQFTPAEFRRGDEPPDAEYPLVFITGRILEHWHTGAMTRRAGVLDALEPLPMVSMAPAELAKLGLAPGDAVTVRSRRGSVTALVRRDPAVPAGSVFMPFAYVEAAANLLTNPKLDPFGKIPEFKYCAVGVERAATAPGVAGYGIAAEVWAGGEAEARAEGPAAS